MIKKICFFTTHFDFPRQRYLSYYEKILPKNVESFLFCLEEDKAKFKTKIIKKMPYSSKFLMPFILRKFYKENEIDVVINLSGMANIALNLALSTMFTKTKNIFYLSGNPKFYGKDLVFFFTQFFTDRFLVSAKDITEKIKKILFFSQNKIFYLPLTVDTSLYKPESKTKARRKLGLNKKDKIIIFAGRISYLKGSDLILEIIKRNPDKKFILIGQLMDENYKNKKFNNLTLIPSVNANELVDYYNASDLCLFLSRVEGFGLVPREAMACKIPALVSDIESLRMIEPAIKVPLNIGKAQEALDYFFKLDKKEKNSLAKKSREFVLKECSEQNEDVKKKYLKYFLEF